MANDAPGKRGHTNREREGDPTEAVKTDPFQYLIAQREIANGKTPTLHAVLPLPSRCGRAAGAVPAAG